MKKIIKLFLFSFVFMFIFNSVSFAQKVSTSSKTNLNTSKPVLVATVNIYNATNTKINDNTYSISFDLSNREGIQSNIRYGVQLINKANQKIADTKLANEAITLGENESKNIVIKYTIPSYIENGTYRLIIMSENQNGLPLAHMPAGFPERDIIVKNSLSSVKIEKCIFVNSNSSSSLFMSGLVNINEPLSISCDITNTGLSVNGLKIRSIVHKNGELGDIVSNNIVEKDISLKSNETKSINFNLLANSIPQSYVADIFIVDVNDQKLNSSTFLKYNVVGLSASIENSLLDKIDYKLGDIAKMKIFWSASSQDKNEKININAKITDKEGNICGEKIEKDQSLTIYGITNLDISINKNCQKAIAQISITDQNGNILDSNIIDINNPVQKINIDANTSNAWHISSNISKIYVLIFIAVLVLIGFGILKLKHHKN